MFELGPDEQVLLSILASTGPLSEREMEGLARSHGWAEVSAFGLRFSSAPELGLRMSGDAGWRVRGGRWFFKLLGS